MIAPEPARKPVKTMQTKPSTASTPKPKPKTSAAQAPQPVDYTALFQVDPILQQAVGIINDQSTQRKIELSAARRQAIISYGGVPDSIDPALAGDVGADVNTPATRKAAEEATQSGLSTLAQLRKGYENEQEADTASLAARGLLRSGALRQHGMENLGELQTRTAGAQSDLLSGLNSLWKGYLGAESDAAGDVGSAALRSFASQADQIKAGNRGVAERSAGNVRAATPKATKPARKPIARRGYTVMPGFGRAY